MHRRNNTFELARGGAKRRLARILSLEDFETAARRHLPRPVYGYLAGAAEDNQSFRENRRAFADYWFVPRVLVDISRRSQEVSLFGRRYAAPFGIAPLGLTALSAYRGDLALARAAARGNIPMILSGASLIPLEEVIRVNPEAWFQAYLPGVTGEITALVRRVEAAGFATLVITVDIPVAANRENNIRAGFTTPLRPSPRLALDGISHPRWLFGTFLRTLLAHGLPHFENLYAGRGVPIVSGRAELDISGRVYLNWEHVALIRRIWRGRLVVKGILHPDDAIRAREAGADGIIVSNHGGRQLDGAIPPLRVLPDIVTACPGFPVMVDSGFRRGSDVLKALALGASHVFVGRPLGFAAACEGEAGVLHAVDLLRQEVSRNMGMLGVNGIEELDTGLLRRSALPCEQPAGQQRQRERHDHQPHHVMDADEGGVVTRGHGDDRHDLRATRGVGEE